MIFILSISVVSAQDIGNGNPYLNENINNLGDNQGNIDGDSLEGNLENTGSDSLEENLDGLSLENSPNNSIYDNYYSLNSYSLNSYSLNSYSADSNSIQSSNSIDSNSIQSSNSIDSNIIDSNLGSSNSISDLNDGEEGDDSDDEDDGDDDEDNALNTTLTVLSEENWKIYGEGDYTVKLLDENDNPVVGALIRFKIQTPQGDDVDETSYTDEDGIAVLSLNLHVRGLYNIQVSYDGDDDFNPALTVDSNVLVYEQTYLTTSKSYAFRSSYFTISLYSYDGNPLSGKTVLVYIDGEEYTRVTDSKGQVSVKMPSNKKSIELLVIFESSEYYESSQLTMELPVYKKTKLKPLVYTILKGKYFKVLLKGTDGKILKKVKVKIKIHGKTYTRKTNKKGIAYLKIKLKRNVYNVKVSFGHNDIYGPSSKSSTLQVLDPKGQFKRGLNQKNKKSVKRYLYGGGKARITKAILKKARKITKKYSTKLEKANAIFNYVRNNLAYSYYANSLRGASKTLRDKRGNCCDHANLIVAMCRAVKIPARYSHAQGCRFKLSGTYEGHVWAQIYVGGRWYSADGTSYRNTLGHISNWDTRHYYRFRSYRSIPF